MDVEPDYVRLLQDKKAEGRRSRCTKLCEQKWTKNYEKSEGGNG